VDCDVPLVEELVSDQRSDVEWVVVAEHLQQYAWIPIDTAGFELLALADALEDQGLEVAFLPYRPGESGGFTDAIRQPLQLLVRRPDAPRAHDIAIDILGSDCDMIV
jgi:hypothetical protein